jgi:hypothetical protein
MSTGPPASAARSTALQTETTWAARSALLVGRSPRSTAAASRSGPERYGRSRRGAGCGAETYGVRVGGERARVGEVERPVVAVKFEAVELAAAVRGVEAGGQPDHGAGGELQRRLDVGGALGPPRLPVGPDVDGVGGPHPVDGAEPRGQERQRVDRAVVERPD